MKKTQKKLGNKGFSLVELIVVIAIMAVLVGVLAPTLIKNIEKSRESKDAQNIEQIKSAAEIALQNETAYSEVVPATASATADLVTINNSGTVLNTNSSFIEEFSSSMDTSKTKLTSKKYKTATVKVQVNGKGQVSVSGAID